MNLSFKIIPAGLVAMAAVGFWVTEPYGNNPFVAPSQPPIVSTHSTQCDLVSSNAIALVRERLGQHLDAGNLVGASIGFYTSGCGSFVAAGGFSSKKDLEPFSPQTVTRIASITKPMTAIAIMQLHDSGALDIDQPVQNYLADFPGSEEPVTIRHLLSHTSGIPHYRSSLDAISLSSYDTLQKAVEEVYERGFVGAPGDQYTYSSFGYTVLGRVIEKVSARTFSEYLRDEVWQPAGMAYTSLERATVQEGKSRLYVKLFGEFLRSPHSDLSLIYPAGGVQSTAGDLLSFGAAVLNDSLVARPTLEAMADISASLSSTTGDDPYGLGWSVTEHPDFGTVLAHGGSQPGASAQFLILLEKEVVAVALSNAYGTKGSAVDLAYFMADLATKLESE